MNCNESLHLYERSNSPTTVSLLNALGDVNKTRYLDVKQEKDKDKLMHCKSSSCQKIRNVGQNIMLLETIVFIVPIFMFMTFLITVL